MGILKQFLVSYHHVKVHNYSTKTEQNFTDLISAEAAKVMQPCGRKYGLNMGDLVEKIPSNKIPPLLSEGFDQSLANTNHVVC